MDDIRKKINTIDKKIVTLIAKRQLYMPAIGKYKRQNGLPIFQPGREKKIIESQEVIAKELGVETSLIREIFELIFKNSRKIQKRVTK